MKKVLVSIVVMLAVVTAAQATITYSQSSVPAPNTPGSDSWTVVLSTDTGQILAGFDFDIGDNSTLIGQVWGGGPGSTVWANNNWTFGLLGMAAADDSQFPYDTSIANFAITVEAENTTNLTAAFSLKGGYVHPLAATSFTLVQVVLPTGVQIPFSGTVVEHLAAGGGLSGSYAVSGLIGIPEPATMALLAIGGLGVLLRRKR